MTRRQKKTLTRIITASFLMIPAALLPVKEHFRIFLYLIPYFAAGYDILLDAVHGIKNLRPFDENFLMAAATVGAMALGEYAEGCFVMLFYQTGELFQSIAVGKSRRSIQALMDIRPDYANVDDGQGGLIRTDPDGVAVGTVITVLPGERIPIDGTVTEGRSDLDTSSLTGESLPRSAFEGDEVISGCINMTGLLKIRTTRLSGESTAARILDLVENAGSKKSVSENFITKFARVYTPIVCFGALALAVLPPAVLLASGSDPMWSRWIYRALTFLVISCPCALVISIPLSFFAGIGGAGSTGILIKGSAYMETLSRIRHIVFDKTGTMTKGSFEVLDVRPSGMDREKLLEYAALAESFSSHPISGSLRKAAGSLDKSRVTDAAELAGRGVSAVVDGLTVAVGSGRLMEELGIEYFRCSGSGTVIHAAVNGVYAGYILIGDTLKPSAVQTVKTLRSLGIKNTVMLTGDRESAARSAAEELSVDRVFWELLPADKVEKVEELINGKPDGEKLAFVGDGINDAPVLSRADVGIAMGALGSDAAIESADVVLMDDDPYKIISAIKISRKCMKIVYENIFLAVGIKCLCLILGASGHADMWLAIFADVGVMVLAVLNALRMLRRPGKQ